MDKGICEQEKAERQSLNARSSARGWFSRRGSEGGWPRSRVGGEKNVSSRADNLRGRTAKEVAIIGAGPSGLVCAKECRQKGLRVSVFEKANSCGGTWRFDPVPADLEEVNLLTEEGRKGSATVHSSMYDSVRTLIPRELMGFTDYPFDCDFPGSKDTRRFCGPDEVRQYLEAYTHKFDLESLVEFETTVVQVEPVEGSGTKWNVELLKNRTRSIRQFDAVIVANGHNSAPRMPEIRNLEQFDRPCIHSHVYRNADPFEDKRVVILGNSFSGRDVAKDISRVAEVVYVCGRTWTAETNQSMPWESFENVHRSPNIVECLGQGKLQLEDGCVLEDIDILIFCTGYVYDFPFLKSGLVSTKDELVYPLYKQIIHPRHPTLAFLTLQCMVIPFLMAEFQSKFIARIFSGSCELPNTATMLKEIDDSILAHDMDNEPRNTYHYMQETQYEYMDELAKLCKDVNPLLDWRKRMHFATLKAREEFPQDSRDRNLYGTLLSFARLEFSEAKHATIKGAEQNICDSSLILSDLV